MMTFSSKKGATDIDIISTMREMTLQDIRELLNADASCVDFLLNTSERAPGLGLTQAPGIPLLGRDQVISHRKDIS
jgi:hypothetical protein